MNFHLTKLNVVLGVIAAISISGCAQVKGDAIENARYSFDRTLSLHDIAPVASAYVDLPYPQCDKEVLKNQDVIIATIDGPRERRVYTLGGEECVVTFK